MNIEYGVLLVLKDHADNKEDKIEGVNRLETEQMEVGVTRRGTAGISSTRFTRLTSLARTAALMIFVPPITLNFWVHPSWPKIALNPKKA